MGAKVEALIGVDDMLLQLENRGKKRVVKKLIAAGEKLMHIAKMMAPQDTGVLEHAIKMTPDPHGYSGRERDVETGRFLRTEVEVYVDMDEPAMKRKPDGSIVPRNGTVEDYAYEAHEHVTPMGSKNLGERSIEKQLNTPEVEVGGGFMTRAADKIEEGIDPLLAEALDEIVSGLF